MTQEASLTDNKVETTAEQPEVTKNPSQEQASTPKTYTQEQVDAIAGKVRESEKARVLKKFDGIDVERYHELSAKEEQAKLAEQKRKGEFEKILQQQAEKSNATINQLTGELTKIKVDGALLSSASTKKAINPEQVVRLVRDQVKMSDTGAVEVIDPKSGQTRYTDTGESMTVDGLVEEFLKTNPHFVQAGPAGAGSTSNTKSETPSKVDVQSLDMRNPEHRKIYAEYRKKQGIV
jgi:hypothetical protein